MTNKSNTVAAALDDETYQAVVEEAANEDRTVSKQVARILRQWAKNRPTEQPQAF